MLKFVGKGARHAARMVAKRRTPTPLCGRRRALLYANQLLRVPGSIAPVEFPNMFRQFVSYSNSSIVDKTIPEF